MKHLKKIIVLLMAAAMMTALAGCSNPGSSTSSTSSQSSESSSQEGESQSSSSSESEPLVITDSFTVTDPEGLDYDTRYVYKGDENSTIIINMSMSGYNAQAMYDIVYAKGDQAVGEYQIIVADDEASANDLKDFYESQGQLLEQQGNVIYYYSDTDQIQATIATYAGLGVFSGTTAQDYIEWIGSYNGLVEYQP